MAELSILTVCSGNICRSPLAEQLIRARAIGIDGLEVTSAGTYALDGDQMPAQSQAVARAFGIDPSAHRARYLADSHLSDADLVLAMARSHRQQIVSQLPKATKRTFTIREFARLADSLSDIQIAEAVADGETLRERFASALKLVASRRGQNGPLANPQDDDVVDPYRLDDEVFAESAQQLLPGVDAVVRVMAIAAS